MASSSSMKITWEGQERVKIDGGSKGCFEIGSVRMIPQNEVREGGVSSVQDDQEKINRKSSVPHTGHGGDVRSMMKE